MNITLYSSFCENLNPTNKNKYLSRTVFEREDHYLFYKAWIPVYTGMTNMVGMSRASFRERYLFLFVGFIRDISYLISYVIQTLEV